MPTTVLRTCNICEAHCGIAVEVDDTKVLRIAGDKDDTFSRGYICPKGPALVDIYEDPDRLRHPVLRIGDRWKRISWDDAFDLAANGIRMAQSRYGPHAVGTYLGNPGAHNWGFYAFFVLRAALGTSSSCSASSLDQSPQQVVNGEVLGNAAMFAVPDLDRTDYMLMFGANPAVSNGSAMTAPGVRRRLRDVQDRGGRVVVVDPRRTETADLATEHISVIPGGDPFLLLGILYVLFDQDLVSPGRLADFTDGIEHVQDLAVQWHPTRASRYCGVDPEVIKRIATEFATAGAAVAYGRVGICQTRTGSVTHWLILVLNVVMGRFDAPGGSMYAKPPVDLPIAGRLGTRKGAIGINPSLRDPVTGRPIVNGEFPVATLPDQIEAGRIRALIVHAGNPVLSAPGGRRLDAALERLDFFVAIDMYVTETSRHAHLILPPVSALERDDFDLIFAAMSVRNHLRFSPAAVPKPDHGLEDWEIINKLARRVSYGRRGRLIAQTIGRLAPDRLAALAISTGPYGILRAGPRRGLTLRRIKAAPHGIDLGPLTPCLPAALGTPDRRIKLAAPRLIEEANKLAFRAQEDAAARQNGFNLTLIGRRQLRGSNSWLHNASRLMKGKDRCTAMLHPDDAAQRGLGDGEMVRVSSAIGSIDVSVQITDTIRRGVVSIPHGFGHNREGIGWRLAASKPGASVNDINDPALHDILSGNAAMNSVPVKVERL
ncbi:molybdopterin-dependent oxidoreductase [Mycobacteroides abscessus]|uniref:molybdopterin-dependent oxidoreductase n=1 Tax=Mycobacteroides abscessus TaxID=36809 RepID=UPI000D9DE5DC|nr:molybdopterin-dependent oxidoreductase [Mycobacteroides abscessus]SPX87992.1 anaerobic dehydrogenase, typically selenocysteine-containing [Mycobacteroides abscessus]